MKLIVFGPPGAGKGTQAEFISKTYSIPIIGTGHLIRESMKNKTPIGKEVAQYMEKGLLVPDDLVVGLLKERISKPDTAEGYILDGFPRTVPQAEFLSEIGIVIDVVVSIAIEDDEIITRLAGRRICSDCGSSYHIIYKQPKVDGICDLCGGSLIIRDDDSIEVILERLEVYHKETAPVEDYYRNKGKLIEVESQIEIADTKKLTLEALEKFFK